MSAEEFTIYATRQCDWCGGLFSVVSAMCGGGFTWALYKCPLCEKFMATGSYIPDAVGGEDVKTIQAEPIGPGAGCSSEYMEFLEHVGGARGKGLAHILWRVAKQLVSLLEKEYGFGQKEVSKKRQSTPHVLIGKEGGFGPPGLAAEPNLTRTVTCAGCGGTFKVKDDRTGSVNEVVYCSDCAKPERGYAYKEDAERNY